MYNDFKMAKEAKVMKFTLCKCANFYISLNVVQF